MLNDKGNLLPGRVRRDVTRESGGTNPLYDTFVLFILLHFLGFPGQFTMDFGERIEILIDYSCFFLQIVLMLLSSGESWLDIQLLNFKKKYIPIYLFVLFISTMGILIAGDRKKETITCLRLVVTVLFAIWLTEYYSLEDLVNMYYRAQVVYIVFTLLFTMRHPSIAYYYNAQEGRVFRGLYGAKNDAALAYAFGILIMTVKYRLQRDRGQTRISRLFFLVLTCQVTFLLLSKATGAMFCTFFPAFYILYLEKRELFKKRLPLGFMYAAVSIGFFFMALTIIPLFEPLLNALGKDATLTGRIPVWKQLISVVMDNRPLTGYGYEWFWKDETAVKLFHMGFEKNSWAARMTVGSHCVLMEMWINTGLTGLAAYYLMILLCFRNVSSLSEEKYVFCSFFIIFYTLLGLTERSMAPAMNNTLMLFICLAVGCSVQKELKKNERNG